MSYNENYTSFEQAESANSNSRKNLKKSFEDIDRKLRNLQEELTNQKERSLKDKPTNVGYGAQYKKNSLQKKQYQSKEDGKNNSIYSQQRPQTQSSNSYPNRTVSLEQDFSVYNGSNSQIPMSLNTISNAQNDQAEYSNSYSNQNAGTKQKLASAGNSVQEIKTKLRKVFQFYTTFGDRCNASYLKSNKFHKMMLDAGIRDNTIMTQKRLDLLFVAENKHKPNMDFDTFLQLLARIAQTKYRGARSTSEALNHLLNDHLLSLYDNIYHETELGIDEEKLHEEIDDYTILILKHVCGTLIKIFQVYFPWETQTSQQESIVKQRSENALFIFLREFDVCPSLITKSTAFAIWTDILETPASKLTYSSRNPNLIPFLEKDFGTVFTFSKFCAFLVRASTIAYIDALGPNSRKFSNNERFALLLERMELSPGMLNFERKTSTPHNSRNTLIVPRGILQKIFLPDSGYGMDDFPVSKRGPNYDESNTTGRSRSEHKMHNRSGRNLTPDASTRYLNDDQRFNEMNKSSRLLRDASPQNASTIAIGQSLLPIFDAHLEPLQRIFQYYCSFGDSLNTKGMKSIKFQKMLKECGLIHEKDISNGDPSYRAIEGSRIIAPGNSEDRSLNHWEADIIFVKLTGHRQMVEMNEKNLPFNKNVKSPYIGYFNHLYKNQSNHVAASGKLEFEGWLVAIEQVAERLYPEWDVEQAVQYILENNILKLDQALCGSPHEARTTGGQPLKVLVELLKDPDIVHFLSIVHKSLLVYFLHYADSKGLMNFERFVKFCKDFSIFPDILPKSRIMTFFYTLAAIHSTAEHNESISAVNPNTSLLKKSMSSSRILGGSETKAAGQLENELIDQHLFVEALALCAFEIPYGDPQPSDIEKICFFLERANQSEGPLIVQKAQGHTRSTTGASWDILYLIRKKYPEIFMDIRRGEKYKHDFDDLIKESIRTNT